MSGGIMDKVKVDIEQLDTFICRNCEYDKCVPMYRLKRLPPLLSGTGKEQIIKVEVGFACAHCGKNFMEEMREVK